MRCLSCLSVLFLSFAFAEDQVPTPKLETHKTPRGIKNPKGIISSSDELQSQTRATPVFFDGNSSINTERKLNKVELASKFGTSLSELEIQHILTEAKRVGLDPDFFASMIAFETGWGKSRVFGMKNFIGSAKMYKDDPRLVDGKFPSKLVGISVFAEYLQKKQSDMRSEGAVKEPQKMHNFLNNYLVASGAAGPTGDNYTKMLSSIMGKLVEPETE